MAWSRKKTATGGCTVAVITYIACKLMMGRRTTRIKNTTQRDEGFRLELGDVQNHRRALPFLGIFNIRSVTRHAISRQVDECKF